MTFDLGAILVFTAAAVIYAAIIPSKGRGWFLLVGSTAAIFWLQPSLPIRFSDFILPAATIILVATTWWVTRLPASEEQSNLVREDLISLGAIILTIVGLSLFRYVDAQYRLTASRPPSPAALLIALALVGGALLGFYWLARRASADRQDERSTAISPRALSVVILFVVLLFVILKTEVLASGLSQIWRGLTGQDRTLASPIDLQWLGFSFVAFRLLHTLRDRQTGLLPVLSLREFVSYAIFFPAYTAGPIDRAERFTEDYRALPVIRGLDPARWARGLERITIGLLKKFIIADLLVQGLSLNASNALQAQSSSGLWILLYGYALRIYFDFGGYSDIAIGLGTLFGIRLPENFSRPYFRSSITEFWQSWHITLSSWVRFYVFTPLSRWLLKRTWRPSTNVIVLTAQMSTMVIIGLWHGITINFFIWGAWHGLALFIHKLWSDRTRKWYRSMGETSWKKRGWSLVGWFLTFNYVTLGWVWFALPTVSDSTTVFGRLFGIGW